MATRLRIYWPAAVSFLVAAMYAASRLSASGWDARSLATAGGSGERSQSWSKQGYDGQFTYAIALDPDPSRATERLDVPAYRYQRILLPLAARALALGQEAWIPWTLLVINLAAHTLGTAAVVRLVVDRGLREGFAITFGLWVGLIAGVGLDLTEPLAFALIAFGWLLRVKGKAVPGNLALGLALFAKETSLLFLLAALLSDWLEGRRRGAFRAGALGVGAFAVWQVWLWSMFGSPGLASGGDLATPFEAIPFLGLLRVGGVSKEALGLYLVVFGPTIVAPALWAGFTALRGLRSGQRSAETWSLLFQAAAIAFLPFSTFREPLGLVRFASGLVVGTLFYASLVKHRRALVYGLLWTALLAILFNQ